MQLKIPPVVQFAIVVGMMWLGHKFLGSQFQLAFEMMFIYLFSGCGFILIFLALYQFKRLKTTVNPKHPAQTSSLAYTGIYKLTRNPMYLGMLCFILAAFIKFGLYWNAFWILSFIWYMTRFQIRPEEEQLRAQFGAAYVAYTEKVRRWI